jgi:hypothetical protein
MRRAARVFVRLYPAQWRARYGEEFATLIEDSSPGWREAFDLLKGAIRMQLHVPAFPKLAVILSLAGLVIGLAASFLVTPTYVSSAKMELMYGPAAPAEGRVNLQERLVRMEQEILSRTSLSALIQDPRLDLYKSERARIPLEDVIEQMRGRDITIRIQSAASDYVPFTISFAYSDPDKARQTAYALMTKFMDSNQVMQATALQIQRSLSRTQIERLEARIAVLEKRLGIAPAPAEPREAFVAAFSGINIDVLDPPSLPTLPATPNREIFAAIGFGAGFAAALVIAVFRRRPPAVPFPAQAT